MRYNIQELKSLMRSHRIKRNPENPILLRERKIGNYEKAYFRKQSEIPDWRAN